MNSSREEAVVALALMKPALERADFLNRECGENPALRERIEALLAEREQSETLVATQIEPTRSIIKLGFADEPPDETVGQTLGRYKLLEKIGEGGCGVVYVADQTEPVRRRVALKVIKLGMDTKQVVARFEAERQALAMMDHPNIAKVLDAGTTEQGRPYFVMELVRGIPFTDYCDQAQLNTKERLDLFIKVCQAIQHAHQKGIIHRDIKPSNILVTLHDGVPVPKVIDFGIAKATEGRLTDNTVYTQLHQFIGTPAYMSPEQAEMSGLDIDTRSDIYSLGVLLYELLSGSTPFDPKELIASGIDAMRKTIREKEPERPSTRLATLKGDELTTTAKRRSADHAKLLHQLQGDLDWIVMKCLEKDRTRRYETANGLAADLTRHFTNEPVLARPPSAAYKFQKAFRRNKLVFSAGAIVGLALLLGIGISTWQATVANRARTGEREQRLAAQAERDKAQAAQKAVETEKQRAEASLYASDMNLAQQELSVGNLGAALDLLDRHRPQIGKKDLRGWEWRYLWQESRRDEQFTLGIHSNCVTGVAFSPDGRLAATADAPNGSTESGSKVLLWDIRTRKQLSFPLTEDAAGSVVFSPDGRHIAFGTLRHGIKVLDVTTRRQVAEFPGKQNIWAHGLAFSPDGKILAIGGLAPSISLFEIATGIEVGSLVGIQDGMTSLAFLPNGERLVSGSWDNTMKVWDIVTREPVTVWNNHTSAVFGVAVSPDGRVVASSSNDGTILLYSLETSGQIAATVYQDNWPISSISFSPDGKTIAHGGSEHSVRILDAASGKEVRTLRGHRDEVWAVAYSPDGGTLLTGAKDGAVKVWNNLAIKSDINFRANPPEMEFSTLTADGRWVFELGTDQIYRIVEVPSLREIVRRPLPRSITNSSTAALAPNGITLAYGTRDGVIGVLNVISGQVIKLLSNGDSKVCSLHFSRDGTVLAGSDQVGAKVWDAHSFDEIASIHYSEKYGDVGLSLSPDGRRLAVSYDDGQAEIWEITQQTTSWKWKAHRGIIRDAVFFPDGQTLATASVDGRVKLWDWRTKQAIEIGRALNSFQSATLCKDSSRLVAGAGEGWIRIYDSGSHHQLITLKGHNYKVKNVAFLADDCILASIGGDGVRLWRAPSWEEIAVVEEMEKTRIKQP